MPKDPPFLWEVLVLLQALLYELFSPAGNKGAKVDAKWWPSNRCMFDFGFMFDITTLRSLEEFSKQFGGANSISMTSKL